MGDRHPCDDSGGGGLMWWGGCPTAVLSRARQCRQVDEMAPCCGATLWRYTEVMARINLREVSEDDKAALEREAARRGYSLNSFMLDLVHNTARRVRNQNAFASIASLSTEGLGKPDSAEVVRALRDERASGHAR